LFEILQAFEHACHGRIQRLNRAFSRHLISRIIADTSMPQNLRMRVALIYTDTPFIATCLSC
jgi:hypothetical protein